MSMPNIDTLVKEYGVAKSLNVLNLFAAERLGLIPPENASRLRRQVRDILYAGCVGRETALGEEK